MKDIYLAQLMASTGAFIFAAIGAPATLSLLESSHLSVAGIAVLAVYFAIFFGPFWLVDATILRPFVLFRYGWMLLAPVELVSLGIYFYFLRLGAFSRSSNAEVSKLLVQSVQIAVVFYGLYATGTLVLLKLTRAKTAAPRKDNELI